LLTYSFNMDSQYLDLNPEEAVIGGILLDNNVLPLVLEIINNNSFLNPVNRRIFESILKVYQAHIPIDILTLSNQLKKDGIYKEIGGSKYLTYLVNSIPSVLNISYYAKLVKESYIRKEIVDLSGYLKQVLNSKNKTVTDVLEEIQKKVFSLSLETTEKGFYDAKTLLEMQMEKADQFAKDPTSLRGISTGFKSLDKMLNGLHKSDLIIIAARPSVGKSAFAFDIARNIAVNEKKTVAIFSLEMPALQVIERMLSQQTGLNLWNIRMGSLGDRAAYEKYNIGAASIAESNLFIDDTSGVNIVQVRSKSRKLMLEKGLDLIVIDYLQLMQGTNNTENRAIEIGEISRSLKILARELNVPIIALSQLNRAVESRQDKVPQLSDLRESGSIEQDADIVIFLGRDVINQSDLQQLDNSINNNQDILKIDVIIAKHRNGPTGKFQMNFIPHQTKFLDLDSN